MNSLNSPFDDTVQLEEMYEEDYSVSDTAPIIQSNKRGQEDENSVSHPESTVTEPKMDERGAPLKGKRAAYITVATLLFINLLNYMDRYTVAG